LHHPPAQLFDLLLHTSPYIQELTGHRDMIQERPLHVLHQRLFHSRDQISFEAMVIRETGYLPDTQVMSQLNWRPKIMLYGSRYTSLMILVLRIRTRIKRKNQEKPS